MSPRIRALALATVATAAALNTAAAAPPCPSGSYLYVVGPTTPPAVHCAKVTGGTELQNPDGITVDLRFFVEVAHNPRLLSKGDGVHEFTDRAYDVTLLMNGIVQVDFFLGPIDTTDRVSLQSQATIAPGTWYRVTASFDSAAGEARLYLNDRIQDIKLTNINGVSLVGKKLRQSSHPLAVGCTPNQPETALLGGIDEVRVWTRALSFAEVLGTVGMPLDDHPGLAASFHFDDHLYDLTGGHVATLHGNAVFAGNCAVSGNYGVGSGGSGGVPSLSLSAPPVHGKGTSLNIGNPTGVPAPGLVMLGVTPAQVPAFGGTLLVQPLVSTVLGLGPSGAVLPFQAPGANLAAFLQTFIPDPTAPKKVAVSRGLFICTGT